MLIIRALAALVLLAAAAPSQEAGVPASPTDVKPSESCTVAGQVVKSTTGEGLKKITLQMQLVEPRRIIAGEDCQVRSATTDANGHFLFNDLEPGRYVMSASGNGYPRQHYGQQERGRRMKVLVLSPGQHEKDIVVRLQPPGVITGTVNDEDGDPVIYAEVHALRLTHQGKRRQVMGASGAQTNDRGEYRVFGLEPGEYFVVVSYQRQQAWWREARQAQDDVYVPTFFPGTQDPGQATPVQVEPGDEVGGIDVDLRLVHGVRVRGRLQSEGSPLPVEGLYVSLTHRDSDAMGYPMGNYGANVQDKSGAFEIHGVPPGSYFLSANWSDGHRQYYGRVSVDVGNANVEGVTLVIGSGMELHGRFRTDSDAKNYKEPDYIKLYENHGTRVHIEEKRQQNVQLELIQAEEEPQE